MRESEMSADLVKPFVLASHGNLEAVQTMLVEHPDLLLVQFEWGPNDYEDGLGAASHVGNRAVAEFFLSKGVPTTICTAAMLGHIDEVKAFLDKDPALANAKGAHGITLMFHASMSGDLELLKLLKSRGCTEGYSDALHGAISYKYTDLIAWLLDNGATDVNVPNWENKTPLQRAQASGQTDVVELLKAHRAS
jgi:ankyrin repeat protein